MTCRIGHEEFALDVLNVQEINRTVEITRVPKALVFVQGVINLRGRIIPVLNLRHRFGLPLAGQTDDSRIMVVLVRQRMVGLIVDEVVEVLRIPKCSIEAPPSVGSSAGAEFTLGIGRIADGLLIVLDLNRLLMPNEQTAIDAATEQGGALDGGSWRFCCRCSRTRSNRLRDSFQEGGSATHHRLKLLHGFAPLPLSLELLESPMLLVEDGLFGIE